MFLIFETEKTHNPNYLIEQVNTLTDIFAQFEEQKMKQIQDPETLNIAR